MRMKNDKNIAQNFINKSIVYKEKIVMLFTRNKK